QQQDRRRPADRDREAQGGGRPAAVRPAALPQSDADARSPDEAVPRGAARYAELEQHDRADPDRRRHPAARSGDVAEESEQTVSSGRRAVRTGWDSNPRYPCGYTGFRDRLLQPLG